MEPVFKSCMLIGAFRIVHVIIDVAETLFECIDKSFGMTDRIRNELPGIRMYCSRTLLNDLCEGVSVADGQIVA